MLRTGGLHSPYESSTPRFDTQVSPNVGGLLQRVLVPPLAGLSPASHRGLSGHAVADHPAELGEHGEAQPLGPGVAQLFR